MRYDPASSAKPLFDHGVRIFAVSMGDDADQRQLRAIVGYQDRIFQADVIPMLEKKAFIQQVAMASHASLVPSM